MDIPDALTLARLDSENQGPWEAEYSYEGEEGLHQLYNSCKKNPGHKDFIPVEQFSIEDLPRDYRHNDMLNYIRAVSDLTVRVTVKYVSDKRPATVPGSDRQYPGYNVRGRRRITVGTGWVNYVTLFKDKKGYTCKCKACQSSSTPETHFSIININTASHIVFDDQEAEHTTCHLFFDRGNRPEICRGVVTLTGMSTLSNDADRDKCFMEHYTHDLDLANKLYQTHWRRHDLRDKIIAKLPQTCRFKWRLTPSDKQPWLCIVSHPHGCSKQISLGHWTSAHKFNNTLTRFQYSAATCPGSSGAPVCMPQLLPSPDISVSLFTFPEAHCGASDVQLGNNYCHIFSDDRSKELEPLSVVMLQLDLGSWEDSFCCGEDEDLHKHDDTCQKNPGHQNFIPVDKFGMDNLPPCYRKDKIIQLIRLVSDLTVRVSVTCVSPERPETVPGTDTPYPWCSSRGDSRVRTGCGLIIDRIRFEDYDEEETCGCKECRNSPAPKTEFSRIYVKTARHLVYDSLEGEHTTCQLLFDSGETLGACQDIVTLTDVLDIQPEVESDECVVTFITHDLDLAKRLQNMILKYKECLDLLQTSDYFNLIKDVKQNGRVDPKQEPPLCIAISHPHGCAKQVTVGYCGSHDNTAIEGQGCPNTWLFCPGFSGAPIIVLGWVSFYPCCEETTSLSTAGVCQS